MTTTEADDLPQQLLDLLPKLPVYTDRKDGAALVTQYCFPVSPQTVKSWPLDWSYPNGCAVTRTEAYLRHAWSKMRRGHPTTNRWPWLRRAKTETARPWPHLASDPMSGNRAATRCTRHLA
jgi:hypothetical protein